MEFYNSWDCMSDHYENLVGSCIIEPKNDLSIFWTIYSIDSAEYQSKSEELEIFGDFKSVIMSSFSTLGFPLVATQIRVFSFFNLEEDVPIPQTIMCSYYPVEPKVFFFVVSNKIISIDNVLKLTENLHKSADDSLKYYNKGIEKGIIKQDIREFLKDKICLQHFPAYLDYNIFNTPSNYIDNIFNLKILPLKLKFTQSKISKKEALFPKIEKQVFFDNHVLGKSEEYPEIKPVFEDVMTGLNNILREGITNFGKVAGREYHRLIIDIDTILFEIDKKEEKYFLYQGIHEPFGLGTDEITMNSFYCLSYSSKDVRSHLTTGAACKNTFNKILQKTKGIDSQYIIPNVAELIEKNFPLVKWVKIES